MAMRNCFGSFHRFWSHSTPAATTQQSSIGRSRAAMERLERRRLFAVVGSGGYFNGDGTSGDAGITVTLSENWFDADSNITRTATVSGLPTHTKISFGFSCNPEVPMSDQDAT